MCGIAGVYGRPGEPAREELLLAMAGELRHRGPDGTGLYRDGRFGMVNTRLSIVDIEGGDQPIADERGRYWAMQNGEIFNAPELQAELEARGHVFATRCDTEVLVHAYEEWGIDSLHRLNGEFAFAIWDHAAGRLFLARDRFGVRPLFLTSAGCALAFASEGKALLRLPRLARELDPAGLVEAFTLWATSPARSAFRGIHELPPGHYLLLGPEGAPDVRRWWDFPLCEPEEMRMESEAQLAGELEALLDDAVRLRLRADVPVGTYLSGGLDSSATTALAQRHASRPVRAFGIGFADGQFDESAQQRRVATHLGAPLERVCVSDGEVAALMPRVVALSEKPTLRTAPAPLLRLSRLVRDARVKVVLTGEGADEVFGGYDVFKLDRVRRFWAREPASTRRPLLLGRLFPYLATDLGRAGALLPQVFGHGLTDVHDPLYSHALRFAHAGRALRFFGRAFLDAAGAQGDPVDALRARLPADFLRYGALGRAQYVEVVTFMCGYLLHSQGDRMLMGHSVEGRFPFLDHRVAHFAARLPEHLKLRGLREKHLLRRAVRRHLPPDIAARVKQPYRAPILRAFIGPDAPEYVSALLAPARLAAAGVFEPTAVERLLAKCHRQLAAGVTEADEMALVGILSVMLLHEQFVARPVLVAPTVPNRVVHGSTVVRSTNVASVPA
jgi:asparagine synthase (glutamine-hydrolysing)